MNSERTLSQASSGGGVRGGRRNERGGQRNERGGHMRTQQSRENNDAAPNEQKRPPPQQSHLPMPHSVLQRQPNEPHAPLHEQRAPPMSARGGYVNGPLRGAPRGRGGMHRGTVHGERGGYHPRGAFRGTNALF